MARPKTKKITVNAVKEFFDKKENKKRKIGDIFEMDENRLKEINDFEKINNLVLIKSAEDDIPEDDVLQENDEVKNND